MVVIFSYLSDRGGSALSVDLLTKMAICSNYFAQKFGFKTVLYTDKKGVEYLKYIPYNEIHFFDENIISQFPRSVWSAGKILAASIEKRPFIHLDFDFLILNRSFLQEVYNKPFFAFHDEPWSRNFGKKNKNTFLLGIHKILEVLKTDLPSISEDDDLFSVNFSMFGSLRAENINIINEQCKYMVNAIIKYRDYLDGQELDSYFQEYFGKMKGPMIPIVIEQVLLLNMIKKALGSYYTLIEITDVKESYDSGVQKGLLHLWDAKRNYGNQIKIDNLCKKILTLEH